MVNFFHFDQENVYLAARTLILFGTKFEEILTSYSFSHAACPIFVQHGFWSKIGQIFGQERLDLMVNQLNQERSPCWALRKPLQDNCVPLNSSSFCLRFQTRCTGEGAEFCSMDFRDTAHGNN